MSFTENLYLKRQIQQLQEENLRLKRIVEAKTPWFTPASTPASTPGTGLYLPYQTLHGQAYKRLMDADKQGISDEQRRELINQASEAMALARIEQGWRPSVPASHWMAKESIPNLQKMLLTHSEEEIRRSIDNNIPLAGLGKPYRFQG